MRISDWSSDVCSSDLESGESFGERRDQDQDRDRRAGAGLHLDRVDRHREVDNQPGGDAARRTEHGLAALDAEIGRASCRDRVCPYVYISLVAVSLKKNT